MLRHISAKQSILSKSLLLFQRNNIHIRFNYDKTTTCPKRCLSSTKSPTTSTSRSTSTISSTQTNNDISNDNKDKMKTYNTISKTLYKQILRWTQYTGFHVPFDPMPPLTLSHPLIDKESLLLLQQLQHQYEQKDENDIHYRIHTLFQNLPSTTIIDDSKIVIPIYNAKTVYDIIRFVYTINHHHNNNDNDNNISIIKDRISLGFEVLKSLNQLSELLNERKEAHNHHQNRNGVLYHIGQIVQHKSMRWRGIISGWKRIDQKNSNESTSSNKSSSSLTTKEYESNNDNDDEFGNEIEYTVLLDEGDAVLSRSRVFGSKRIKQNELEIVKNVYLKRIRCSFTKHYFHKFDSNKNEFEPGDVLMYEYPNDINTSGLRGDKKINYTNSDHAQFVINEMKVFAQRLLTQCIWLDPVLQDESKSYPFITEIMKDLRNITTGEIAQHPSDIFMSSVMPSSEKVAVQNVNAIREIIQKIIQVMWHRRTSLLNRERIQYSLGDTVRHKKYNFRGIITGWDAYPRTDVSRWDGLQHIKGNVNNMPFYHVIADVNDTAQAFGNERPFRYVCQENLELCNTFDRQNLQLDLDHRWMVHNEGTDMVEYIAPDEVRFQHGEQLEGDKDEVIEVCMNALLNGINEFLLDIRKRKDFDDHETSNDKQYLNLDDMLTLLQHTDCQEDAYVIEEFIKEVWKANPNHEVRWSLEDGTEALLRGDTTKAQQIFDDIIQNQDPEYLEAYNKKSTCHYMRGEMEKSIDAAKFACNLEPRHFQAYAGLGLVYNDTSKHDALTYFEKSLSLQPWSPVSSRLSACLDFLTMKDHDNNEEE